MCDRLGCILQCLTNLAFMSPGPDRMGDFLPRPQGFHVPFTAPPPAIYTWGRVLWEPESVSREKSLKTLLHLLGTSGGTLPCDFCPAVTWGRVPLDTLTVSESLGGGCLSWWRRPCGRRGPGSSDRYLGTFPAPPAFLVFPFLLRRMTLHKSSGVTDLAEDSWGSFIRTFCRVLRLPFLLSAHQPLRRG